jgi:hypothetical protein
MYFVARAFTLAKDPDYPNELQDAYQLDPQRGLAAVADGVASAIFSGQWATLLSAGVVAEDPDPTDPVAFAQWLKEKRKRWAESIDVGGLAWFQRAKLPLGAFSTLLWIKLRKENEAAGAEYRLMARAIGDSCLFHVRGNECLRVFPIQDTAELERDPLAIGSVDLERDHLLAFHVLDEPCRAEDLIVLCTDAVAEWALRETAAGQPLDWQRYWEMPQEQWRKEVIALREQGKMRYDDTTLVLLRVGAEEASLVAEEPLLPAQAPLAAGESLPESIFTEAPPRLPPFTAPAELPPDLAPEPEVEVPIIVVESEPKSPPKTVAEQFTVGIEQASEHLLRSLRTLWEKARELRERLGKGKKQDKP